MKSIYSFILSSVILTSLSGCEPFAIASTAVVGTTLAEERSAGDKVDDNIIQLKIKEKYTQAETREILLRVSVSVMEGRVMLTGSVSEQKYSDSASDIAWKTRGVKEVINEIEVGEKEPKDRAKDLFISSTISSKLLFEKDLKSLNYIVDVNDQVVFLLGIAQNKNELNRALKIASEVKGVQKVVNHVILKNDPRRTANQTGR